MFLITLQNSKVPVLYWPFAHILGADAIKNDGVYSRYFSQYTGQISLYGKSAHLGFTRDTVPGSLSRK